MWILRPYLNLNLFEQKRICGGYFLLSFVNIVLSLEIGLNCAIWWLKFSSIKLHLGVMYIFLPCLFLKNMSPNIIDLIKKIEIVIRIMEINVLIFHIKTSSNLIFAVCKNCFLASEGEPHPYTYK